MAALLLGLVLGLGRWPLEYAHNAIVWLQRYMAYRARAKAGG